MQLMGKAVRFAVAMGAVALSAVSAQAQFSFVGSTRGCFFGAFNGTTTCTPGSGPTAIGAGAGSLSFSESTFEAMAVDGIASFNTSDNNFGNFTLLTGNRNFAGNGFVLEFLVTSPAEANGLMSALLTGRVRSNNASSVFIDFDNNEWTLLDPASAGISARVTDLAVRTGTSNFVNGQLMGSVVPEPSTYALMGTGLVGLLGVALRRRRSA